VALHRGLSAVAFPTGKDFSLHPVSLTAVAHAVDYLATSFTAFQACSLLVRTGLAIGILIPVAPSIKQTPPPPATSNTGCQTKPLPHPTG